MRLNCRYCPDLDEHRLPDAAAVTQYGITVADLANLFQKMADVNDSVSRIAQIANDTEQMLDILRGRLSSRKIDIRALDIEDPETNLAGSRQKITVKQGIEQPIAKKLVAALKEAKLKVEAQINGDKLRVTGKKRDDLQSAMALLRKTDVELPLQFDNFRD